MASAAKMKAAGRESARKNATLAFRSALSDICRLPNYRGRPRNDALRDLGFFLRRFKCVEDAEDVLDGLLTDGIVAEVNGRILPASRIAKRTAAERNASFEDWVGSISWRATEDPEARLLLASLIRRMTRLHGVHRVATSRGEGILTASNMAFVCGQPEVVEATVIILGKSVIETYEKVDISRISCTWRDEWPFFECDIDGLKRRSRRDSLMEMRLVGSKVMYDLYEILQHSNRALEKLFAQREEIESFIGLSLPGNRWNGLRMSLKSSRSLVPMARRALLGMLRPDVRRVALRHPFADFAFYYWIKDCSLRDLNRRIQMSDAFPAMTYGMRELDGVIREGGPLLPALQEMTGIDIPRMKRLRGVHWQRLGHAVRCLIPDDESDGINYALTMIASARYPVTKKQWHAFSSVSHWQGLEWLPEEHRKALLDASSRNWEGYAQLFREDLAQAVADCADNLVPLIDLHLRTEMVHENIRASMCWKVFEHVAGRNYGLKRLRLFNEAWHKGAGTRGLKIRAIRKSVFGEEQIAKWRPLTEVDFTCAAGSLVWMTNEDQLILEGRQMSHCVGSYWASCVQGTSHIAQVQGFDGTRSTVEFELSEKGRVSRRQHHTYRNGTPSQACAAVVAKFLAENRKTAFPIIAGDAGSKHRGVRRERITIKTSAEIREAYADCLSFDFLDDLETFGRRWRADHPGLCLEEAEAARRARQSKHGMRDIMQK